jgi:methionyl-tRNA formyltransferase
MMLSVVVDNPRSWFIPFAQRLAERLGSGGNSAQLLSAANEIPENNDVAFFLSCEKKVAKPTLARSKHNIVVHASDLPQGKGMSPLTWQVLEGKDVIPITLFEAVEEIDAGPIYLKDSIQFRGSELLNEMHALLGAKIIEMCERFVGGYPSTKLHGEPQQGDGTAYRRRKPEDSRLDPNKSIAEQFNLLRVVDNERYPAFFELKGRKFILRIEPARNDDRAVSTV